MTTRANHNGYTYQVCLDGRWYVATCERTGHTKTRRDIRVWFNDLHKRVTDTGLIAVLETAVSIEQGKLDSASTPRVNGPAESAGLHLYNRAGQRMSLASERPSVQRKQPRGTWRDDRGGA